MPETFPLHLHHVTPRGCSVLFVGEGTHLIYGVNSNGGTPWWREDDRWHDPNPRVDVEVKFKRTSSADRVVPDLDL